MLQLLGLKFNRLTAIAPAGSNAHGKRLWRCRCDCGGFTQQKLAWIYGVAQTKVSSVINRKTWKHVE